MITPTISLVAYEARDKLRIFVKVPDERGKYFLCHRCVVLVECPHCGSSIGEPCKGAGKKYTAGHHWRRAQKANQVHGYGTIGLEDQTTKPRVKLVLKGSA